MSILKVLIFDSYGFHDLDNLPKKITKDIGIYIYPDNRHGEIVKELELLPNIEDTPDSNWRLSNRKDDEIVRKVNWFQFGKSFRPAACRIVEVDTNRKWTISQDDKGREYIEYLEPTLISESINFWE